MGHLSIYLPPFASDYSGACAALFDFDCLTTVNDAGCCTSSYVYCDEPRWKDSTKTTFSTMLRNIDAVFGHDDQVIDQVCAASEDLASTLVAMVATPVPAIIGMDTIGVAHEVEDRIDKPTLGLATTGFSYFDEGVTAAAKALFDRYAEDGVAVIPSSVNLLGLTPLDLGDMKNVEDLCALISAGGFIVNATLLMNTSLDQIRRVGAAETNLAVTGSGPKMAKYLHKRFGTPYVCGCPMGSRHADTLVERLSGRSAKPPVAAREDGPALLLIMDQVMGVSLREALELAGYPRPVRVGGFFGWDLDLARSGDVHLASEKALVDLFLSGDCFAWVGDPFYGLIPELGAAAHVELVHPAVSGRPRWDEAPLFLSPAFDGLLAQIARL